MNRAPVWVAVVAVAVSGCWGVAGQYRAAVAADSSERYRAFLYEYPSSEYTSLVEARLEDRLYRDLKDGHESGDIGSTSLLSLADAYLEDYPSGKRSELVTKIRDEVQDEIRMLELCPLPLLDEVRGADERIGPLVAEHCMWLMPGQLRFSRVTHIATSPADEVASAEIVLTRKYPLPPVDVFVAQIKTGGVVVVGIEAPADAKPGSWMLTGKVSLVTASAKKKAELAKAAGKKGPVRPTVLEIPFKIHVAIDGPPAPHDERDALLLGRAWELYERKAADREKERDLNGFCRSSRADLYARCGELTADAETLRDARDRAAVTLRTVVSGPDDKAKGAATGFFAAHPEAKKAAKKARPAPKTIGSGAPGTGAAAGATGAPASAPAGIGPTAPD